MNDSQYNPIAKEYHVYTQGENDLGKLDKETIIEPNISDLSHKSVLDIGCGSGVHLKYLLSRFPDIDRIAGIDNSEELIKIAKDNDSSKCEFTLSDMDSLPFPDNTFDFIFSRYTIHYSNDLIKTLKEIYRVTKPGGSFYLLDAHPMIGLFRKSSKDYKIKETVDFPVQGGGAITVRHPTFTIDEYIKAILVNDWKLVDFKEEMGSQSKALGVDGYSIPTKLSIKLIK